MTGLLYRRHRIWIRAIATVVLCLFLVNEMSYGLEVLTEATNKNTLSALSRFKPIDAGKLPPFYEDTENEALKRGRPIWMNPVK